MECRSCGQAGHCARDRPDKVCFGLFPAPTLTLTDVNHRPNRLGGVGVDVDDGVDAGVDDEEDDDDDVVVGVVVVVIVVGVAVLAQRLQECKHSSIYSSSIVTVTPSSSFIRDHRT